MAKGNGKGVPNKHLHARLAYLEQAAKYLASCQQDLTEVPDNALPSRDSSSAADTNASGNSSSHTPSPIIKSNGLPMLYGNQLRAVSLKGQIRLSHDTKRSFCKVCNKPLIAERTSREQTQNLSKSGKKPHAEMRIVRCLNCGTEKKYPVAAQRQMRKTKRDIAASCPSSQAEETKRKPHFAIRTA